MAYSKLILALARISSSNGVDAERPCLRCVKRNLGDTCQDGVRKKAKYLRDIDDEGERDTKSNCGPCIQAC